jgi:tRNA threonylcarbamoyladenosine biosynthesis protein TsaB
VLILSFDTSTPAVTVALHDGVQVLAERTVIDARRTAELLAPGIAAALADAGRSASELTQIAVGVGPGPFTGLRVGLVTARALSDVLAIPVVGVCSLDILAADISSSTPFLVATDARRREVYWAAYDSAGRRIEGPFVGKAADIERPDDAYGAGAVLYKEFFGSVSGPELPRAATLAGLVATGRADLLPPDPLYLRRPDAVAMGVVKAVTQS